MPGKIVTSDGNVRWVESQCKTAENALWTEGIIIKTRIGVYCCTMEIYLYLWCPTERHTLSLPFSLFAAVSISFSLGSREIRTPLACPSPRHSHVILHWPTFIRFLTYERTTNCMMFPTRRGTLGYWFAEVTSCGTHRAITGVCMCRALVDEKKVCTAFDRIFAGLFAYNRSSAVEIGKRYSMVFLFVDEV